MPDESPAVARVLIEPLEPGDAPTAAALLADGESAVDGELVDEAERRRLAAFAGSDHQRAPDWYPLVARRGSDAVGYAALVLPASPGGTAVGDAAPLPDVEGRDEVLTSLLAALTDLAARHQARELEVWLRRADDHDLEVATAAGLPARRRVAVLGRPLPIEGAAPPAPSGITVRSYRPDVDDDQVVDVLREAYAGTDDGGWDLAAFRERRGWDWFRADDLLVAEDTDGRLLGLHWLKRRSPTVGEVHNLAIHPGGQGRGLGPLLLRAGLDHLAATGCDEVMLWVDRANDRAVRLYTSLGFTTRWDDVALARAVPGAEHRS